MDHSAARRAMVENQLRPNKVVDPLVIAAMSELPREAFVPKALAEVAYVDEALALGQGRFLVEPMVLARLLQAAEVGAADVALCVGCATGYAAAVLARLANTVVALERDSGLAAKATETLGRLGIDAAVVVEGPLEKGYPAHAPYDVILIDGAVEFLPAEITGQLADGGRLAAVVVEDGIGRGTLVTRYGQAFTRRVLFDAGTPTLPGFESTPAFVF